MMRLITQSASVCFLLLFSELGTFLPTILISLPAGFVRGTPAANVRKCCRENRTFVKFRCVESDVEVSLGVFEEFGKVYGKKCPNGTMRVPLYGEDRWRVNSVGQLEWSRDTIVVTYEWNRFCVDYRQDTNETVALVCGIDQRVTTSDYVYSLGMIISMPFLLVTFIIYTLLPERNLHMKALMSYVMSLFFGYIFLVTIQLYPNKFEEIACSLLGYLCIFAFMLSFYWMNVICVDIWFGFSNLRTFSRQRNSERRRFYFYCAYAWGMSILHIIIILCIQQFSWEGAWYSPGISSGQCFLASGYPELMYFYGPMGILITLNVIFFALTAARIRKVKQDTQMLKKSDSKRHNYEHDKQKFNLYLKLLLAMGINWSMEIISWAVDWKLGSPPPYVWYLTDFCNAAYGVVIFFIFVFKKSIWRLLKKRYYSFIGKPHLAHSMTTTTQTRSTSYSAATSGHEMQAAANGSTALTSQTA